ncbi:hypothetical protein GCK32_011957 [Trichostrongylus colubriformis]|uniref:Uncharacterized protein n=1 Tax=Trichostrongylus colubriformis TaxID=6319 RepID=A0AAN8G9I7_TRICO
MSGSTFKSDGPRSEMYDKIKDQKIADDEECCPKVGSYTPFMKGDEWSASGPRAIANSYQLFLDDDGKSCKRGKNAIKSLLMSFLIEIGDRCEWMRICFDKSKDTWCEKEGNIINLLFNHELFIPTDTDQAQPLAVGYGKVNRMRINFLFDEPAIEMSYAFAGSTNPVISHTMHLKVYEDVGMKPDKLNLHVLRDRRCHARVTSDLSEDFTNIASDYQCLVVVGCECYKYN